MENVRVERATRLDHRLLYSCVRRVGRSYLLIRRRPVVFVISLVILSIAQ